MERLFQEYCDWLKRECATRGVKPYSVVLRYYHFMPEALRCGISVSMPKGYGDVAIEAATFAEAMDKGRAWVLTVRPRDEQIADILGVAL